MQTEVVTTSTQLISKLSGKLQNFFQHSGISYSSARGLSEACKKRLDEEGEDAFLVIVRGCCEELKLNLALLLEETLADIKE